MANANTELIQESVSPLDRLLGHIAIMRFDHSIKNLFVLPGIIVPISVFPQLLTKELAWNVLLAFISVTCIASSNYVLNEVLDAPFDRLHPRKKMRAAARGHVVTPFAYLQWVLLMVIGVGLGSTIGKQFAITAAALWIMGCLYNIPPIRTKDVPILDVLSESVNNPLRMLLGWYAVSSFLVPPISLLVSYWMIGCYFMALKRFSELSEIGSREVAGAYRVSFRHYTTQSLLISVMFYAAAAMLFFGAFIVRYRIELILCFPLVALVMAIYLHLAFKPDSAVQNPEKLYREPLLMGSFGATVILMVLLLFVRIPKLEETFLPTLPNAVSPSITAHRPIPTAPSTK